MNIRPFKMRPRRCVETSDTKLPMTARYDPEERIPEETGDAKGLYIWQSRPYVYMRWAEQVVLMGKLEMHTEF